MKAIYVQLVNKGTRAPFKGIRPLLIQLREFPITVGLVQLAVHEQCNPEVGHVIAGRLDIWHPDALEGECMNPWDVVTDPRKVYIVKVPPPIEDESTDSGLSPLEWSAPAARPQISVSDDDRVIQLPASCVSGSGVGHPGEQLTLYCRPQMIKQWKEMDRCSIQRPALLWVVGPSGTGKSCTALAFAHSLNPQSWSVVWIHYSRWSEFVDCIWFFEGEKRTCSIEISKSQLRRFLRSTSTNQKTVVFLDGYVESSKKARKVRRACMAWHQRDRSQHRLVCVCSMGALGKVYRPEIYEPVSVDTDFIDRSLQNVDMVDSVVTSPITASLSTAKADEVVYERMRFQVESWRFEEYAEAVQNDVFFESVKHVFPSLTEQLDAAAELAQRFLLLEMKYCVAGGSARLMFGVTTSKAMEALDSAIDDVRNFETLALGFVGPTSPDAINRLLSLYHSGDSSDVGLISGYVARKLGVVRVPHLLQKIATLCGVNPSVDGYFFEASFFSMLTFNGVKWTSFELQTEDDGWEQASVVFFDPLKESINIPLQTATWMAPVQWNHGGYDAVFVDREKKLVRFVQVTRGERHGYNPQFFVEFLVKLAQHEYLKGTLLTMVELFFVVPMARLLEFRSPVSSHDFSQYVVKETSSADSIAESTRSHGYPMFEQCEGMVRVVGVQYTMSSFVPAEGSNVH
jgi:DNA polymerase III delta prime subunit